MWITSSLAAAKGPAQIALGNFDGVHLGHQQVMAQILCEPLSKGNGQAPQAAASQADTSQKATNNVSIQAFHSGILASGYSYLSSDTSTNGSSSAIALPVGPPLPASGHYATVVTFSPHPHEYFSGVARPLLTPVAEKIWRLSQLGIHQLIMLPFDRSLAELSPQAFVEDILIDGLQAQKISVGSDFHFGKGRTGNAQNLTEIAGTHKVPVVQVPLRQLKGDRISSSQIREALNDGNPTVAAELLGRAYTLTGRVVQGQQLGRTIGFPTANLSIPIKKYLPRKGVYSVWAFGADSEPVKGVMNIGNRPTVAGQTLSIEVHLLNWTGNLYGKVLTVSLEQFIRPEQKFSSLAQLKSQIAKDCDVARHT
ncbi:MAG: bifunctional riboflavin kinase/FAD synthetase [Cyanobacteria bacterium J06554_3]